MKVTVTHLKAPWPAGTVPGHVVELAGCDAVPGWALGKCVPAPDDAEAVSVWVSARVQTLVVNPASAGISADDPAAEALAAAEAQHQAELAAAAERAATPTKPKRGASA